MLVSNKNGYTTEVSQSTIEFMFQIEHQKKFCSHLVVLHDDPTHRSLSYYIFF
jgi:hypothetical protein